MVKNWAIAIRSIVVVPTAIGLPQTSVTTLLVFGWLLFLRERSYMSESVDY